MSEIEVKEDGFDPSRFGIYFGECPSGPHTGWGLQVSPIGKPIRFRDRFKRRREEVPDAWMLTFVAKPPTVDTDEVYVPDLKEVETIIEDHHVILLPDDDFSRFDFFLDQSTRKRR